MTTPAPPPSPPSSTGAPPQWKPTIATVLKLEALYQERIRPMEAAYSSARNSWVAWFFVWFTGVSVVAPFLGFALMLAFVFQVPHHLDIPAKDRRPIGEVVEAVGEKVGRARPEFMVIGAILGILAANQRARTIRTQAQQLSAMRGIKDALRESPTVHAAEDLTIGPFEKRRLTVELPSAGRWAITMLSNGPLSLTEPMSVVVDEKGEESLEPLDASIATGSIPTYRGHLLILIPSANARILTLGIVRMIQSRFVHLRIERLPAEVST